MTPPATRSLCQLDDIPENGAKGYPALQLSRDLDVQYKTAFVLAHKLREAMAQEMGCSVPTLRRRIDRVIAKRSLDEDAVRPRRKRLDDERFSARINPMPRQVIDGHVQVSDARHDQKRCLAVHGNDPDVFGAVLDDDQTARERLRAWRRNDEARLVL